MFGDRGKEPKWQRADLLRNRIKERLYKHTLLQIQRVRLQTRVFITKISQLNLVSINSNILFLYSVILNLFYNVTHLNLVKLQLLLVYMYIIL